jgi:hypothetical protein
LLCAVQAGWAWLQRDNNFGVSGQIDSLEGWIADPSLYERQPYPRLTLDPAESTR